MVKQLRKVVGYLRLSKEDIDREKESQSIGNQRKIIMQYATEHGMVIDDEYVDDGFSGGNFERPGFQRLIQDIEQGKVGCVIVKDFSRLGRDHILSSYYAEMYFPDHNVRFISVNDGEDSAHGLSDFLPFKALINSMYLKDTSRKIVTAIEAGYKSGNARYTFCPLGYKKMDNDKHKLVPDPQTAWIVQRIFEEYDSGAGYVTIGRGLEHDRIYCPSYIIALQTGVYLDKFDGAPDERKYRWGRTTISSILHNHVYRGEQVHYAKGRAHRSTLKHHQNQLVVEHTHEAIIDEDLFDRVQRKLKEVSRPMITGNPGIFSGIIHCADCHYSMTIERNTPPYYSCNKHRVYGQSGCSMHYIAEKNLANAVLADLNKLLSLSGLSADNLAAELMKKSTDNTHIEDIKKKISSINKRIADIKRIKMKAYEDLALGNIDNEMYATVKEKYDAELVSLSDELKLNTDRLGQNTLSTSSMEAWKKLADGLLHVENLTRDIAIRFIDNILVHERSNGTQEIEVFYKFIGQYPQ